MNIKTAIDANAMRAAADQASDLLKALANRHRLLILCQLIGGEKSVRQLADFLDVRDSTASQHLALLRRDRIIAARRDGQTVWYSLASGPARDVMQSLYAAYCAPSTLEPAERGAHDQDAGRKQRALMEQTYTLKGERR